MADEALLVPNGNLFAAEKLLALPLLAPNTICEDYLLKFVSGDAIPAFLILFIFYAAPSDDAEVELFKAKLYWAFEDEPTFEFCFYNLVSLRRLIASLIMLVAELGAFYPCTPAFPCVIYWPDPELFIYEIEFCRVPLFWMRYLLAPELETLELKFEIPDDGLLNTNCFLPWLPWPAFLASALNFSFSFFRLSLDCSRL